MVSAIRVSDDNAVRLEDDRFSISAGESRIADGHFSKWRRKASRWEKTLLERLKAKRQKRKGGSP